MNLGGSKTRLSRAEGHKEHGKYHTEEGRKQQQREGERAGKHPGDHGNNTQVEDKKRPECITNERHTQ